MVVNKPEVPLPWQTDSDGGKCGGVGRTEDRLRCSVLRFTAGGYGDFEFFGLKISRTQRPGVPLGSIIGGPERMHITFLHVWKFA